MHVHVFVISSDFYHRYLLHVSLVRFTSVTVWYASLVDCYTSEA